MKRSLPIAVALADRPPERLRSVVGRIEGDVPRTRAVREADPRLTLADATALVRGPGA